jgi:hypothetical protein
VKRKAVRSLRREFQRAVVRQAEQPGRRVRRVLPLVAMLALGMAGGAVAVGSAVISSAPDSPDDPPGSARTTTAFITPLDSAELRRLRRERERRAPALEARRYFGALPTSPSDSYHAIYSDAQGQIAIRATEREVCIQFRLPDRGGATDSCAPTGAARTYGVYVVHECLVDAPHPQRRIIAGVAPDGVSVIKSARAGEVKASAAVLNNGFVLVTDEPVDTIIVGSTSRRLPPVVC